jgi:Tol biopolymer transport system component
MPNACKAALAIIVLASLSCTPTARAAFPGTNGSIAYVLKSPTGGEPLIESAFVGPEGTLVPAAVDLKETAVDQQGNAFEPAWSADGRNLAFVSTRAGTRGIYSTALASGHSIASACGMEVCPLTSGAAESYGPSWSFGGQSIVFTSTASGTPQIYTMTATGEDVTRLTFDNATDEHPTWSRSGAIAFVGDAGGSPQIYVMNSQGGELRELTHSGVHLAPTWSPNGSELAYESEMASGFQVFADNPATGELRVLTNPTPEADVPTWSPDGTQMLLARGPAAAGHPQLELINARPGSALAPRRLLGTGEDADWAPLPALAPSSATPATPGVSAIATPLTGSVTVNPGHVLAPEQAGETPAPGREPTTPATGGELGMTAPVASQLTTSVEVPVNSTYDVAQGAVELTVAHAGTKQASTAIVTGGRFLLIQHDPTEAATIKLVGRSRECGRDHASIARELGGRPRVHGHTQGRWKEAGGYGSASSESTRWEVENTCQGTLYRAIEDTLTVTDPHRRHPVRVTAGHSYLVRPGS